MKTAVNFFLVILLTFTSQVLSARESRSLTPLTIKSLNNDLLTAGNIKYDFKIHDESLNRIISEKDLMIGHEKLLHFFIFDKSLNEFQHLHPEVKDGLWTVNLDLNTNGKYWIYVQGKTKRDQKDFTISKNVEVIEGNEAHPIVSLGDKRVGTSGNSVVKLSTQPLRSGQMVMPYLSFSRADGSKPDLTPFLGALAHIVIVGEAGKEFLHVHPMDTENPNQLMLHTEFPKAGEYRVWVQFIDADELKTIPLSVKVN